MSVPDSQAEIPSTNATTPERKQTKICVYCGSAAGKDPAHLQSARELGKLMAENNIKLGKLSWSVEMYLPGCSWSCNAGTVIPYMNSWLK